MRLGSKSLAVLVIALLVLGGAMLVAKRERVHVRALASTGASSKEDTGDAKATATFGGTAQRAPASSAAMPAASHAVASDGAPSAECLAARAADAARNAELEALPAAQVDVLVERTAREEAAVEDQGARALDACEGKDEAEALACIESHGVMTISDMLTMKRDLKAVQTAVRRHAMRTAMRGDARSLVAAAGLLPMVESDGWSEKTPPHLRERLAVDWIVRAQRLGRDDALVQWSVATFRDFGTEGESAPLRAARAAARQQLLVLEPDNAAAHLLSIQEGSGPGAVLSPVAFMRAARLPHYRVPHAERVALALGALDEMPVERAFRRFALLMNRQDKTAVLCASDAEILALVQGMQSIADATVAMPAPPANACSASNTNPLPGMRETCLKFFETLYANARTLLERSAALGVLRGLANDPQQRAHWESEYRRHRWQADQYARTLHTSDSITAARIQIDAWRGAGEIGGLATLLDSMGVPRDPPEGWKVPGQP